MSKRSYLFAFVFFINLYFIKEIKNMLAVLCSVTSKALGDCQYTHEVLRSSSSSNNSLMFCILHIDLILKTMACGLESENIPNVKGASSE